MSLRVNSIGEPDAANLHVRFDERGAETEAMVWTATPAFGESRRTQNSPRPNATAPLLDSTAAATRGNDKSGAHRRHGQATHQHCASVRPWHLWVMLSPRGRGFRRQNRWQQHQDGGLLMSGCSRVSQCLALRRSSWRGRCGVQSRNNSAASFRQQPNHTGAEG